jgi:hypothetical protein
MCHVKKLVGYFILKKIKNLLLSFLFFIIIYWYMKLTHACQMACLSFDINF